MQLLHLEDGVTHSGSQSKVIWDSGATACISNDRTHFVGEIQPNTNRLKLEGIGSNLPIEGIGHVSWSFEDIHGALRTMRLPAYYVPKATSNLLSINSLLQTYPDETINITPAKLILSGTSTRDGCTPVHVTIDHSTNLPTCWIHDPHNKSSPQAMNVLLTSVHDDNKNLTPGEKELLRWHQRLGHLSFQQVQFLLNQGVLARSEEQRRLHRTAAQIRNPPKCAACLFAKQTRRATVQRSSNAVKDRAGILSADQTLPGQRISVDHFVCSTKGRLFSGAGCTNPDHMYCGGCVFVDQSSGFLHTEFQTSLDTHQTLRAKDSFELR